MKYIDVIAAALLVVGGLNWGLVGTADFNPVATVLGADSSLTSSVYALVGIAAVFQVVQLRAIQRRWGVQLATASTT
jgi:uncharacterized membrane protein YuzA (DUF378 family)